MLTSFPEVKTLNELYAEMDRSIDQMTKAAEGYREERDRVLAKIRRALSLLELTISRLNIDGGERATLKELRQIHQELQL
jgi:hypothetical protein